MPGPKLEVRGMGGLFNIWRLLEVLDVFFFVFIPEARGSNGSNAMKSLESEVINTFQLHSNFIQTILQHSVGLDNAPPLSRHWGSVPLFLACHCPGGSMPLCLASHCPGDSVPLCRSW